MSYQNSVAAWTSHPNTEAPTCVVPVALSVAMGLAAVGVLGILQPANAGSAGHAHALSCRDLDCDNPPLMVEGPVVVDLRWHTITCELDDSGAVAGTGIVVTGSKARIRNGKVKNCETGVLVEGEGGHTIERLFVTAAPDASGGESAVVVESDYNVLVRNTVKEYPGEGYRIAGNFNLLRHNKAINNGDHGFQARPGAHNFFLRNISKENQGDGFRSRDGEHNRFARNIAKDNRDSGILVRDSNENRVVGNIVERNGIVPCDFISGDADPGIGIRDATDNLIRGNRTKNNCIGIGMITTDEETPSLNNKIIHNLALRNVLFGIGAREGALNNSIARNIALKNDDIEDLSVDMADENEDCDDNTWSRNIFRTSAAGPVDDPQVFPPCIR